MKLSIWIHSKSLTYCAVHALNITRGVSIAVEASLLSSRVYLFKSTCDGCKSSAEIECLIFMSVKCSFLPSGLLCIPPIHSCAIHSLLIFATSLIPPLSLDCSLFEHPSIPIQRPAAACVIHFPLTPLLSLLPCLCVIHNVA